MLLYSRAVFYGENLKDYSKAELYIEQAYKHGLKLLEGCFATNFTNMIKIRLYFVKLKWMCSDWDGVKDLLLDNIKDSEIELSLREFKNPTFSCNPKAQKCVFFLLKR